MALEAGTRLGPYEVLSPLGAGGMGEVYRARDSKLAREIAIKVIPAPFASDAQRMARFAREAQLLASLNHPNIAHIYGLEHAAGGPAIAMELVEGPNLAERISAGPLPLLEGLDVARQIANALEFAHDRGIVHRDLKPANIKLTHEGVAKLLDFGLAKALEGEAEQADISHSPTISVLASQAGFLLGAAAYMSPEQARGKPTDRRTDIWAFGCVLYEMLARRQLFQGETVTDTLAAVVRAEPDWDALPADTPAAIRRLLRRCLEKDPKRRLQAIGEARIILDEFLADPLAEASPAAMLPVIPPSRFTASLPWIAVALLLALVAAIALWRPWAIHPRVEPVRLSAEVATGFMLTRSSPGNYFAISQDGTRIAFTGVPTNSPEQQPRIYTRSLDALQATALSGTEGGRDPFFSP